MNLTVFKKIINFRLGHPTEMDVTSLSAALEQARLKYHAQTVRSENFYINFSKKLENYDYNLFGCLG